MNIVIENLQEENKKLRNSLDNFLSIDKAENERCWELIAEIVDNEIGQEKLCNQ